MPLGYAHVVRIRLAAPSISAAPQYAGAFGLDPGKPSE
jgi:hypothetical protein